MLKDYKNKKLATIRHSISDVVSTFEYSSTNCPDTCFVAEVSAHGL